MILLLLISHFVLLYAFDEKTVTFHVAEDARVGEIVGSLPASDIIYRLNDNPWIRLDDNLLRLIFPLDREDQSELNLLAIANNPPSILHCQIIIDDINDNAPQFPMDLQNLSIPETAPIGFRLSLNAAIDRDAAENGTIGDYRLNATDSPFKIVTSGAELYLELVGAVDREIVPFYIFELSAYDNGTPPLSSKCLLNITIIDINDNPPVFSTRSLFVKWPSSPINATIARLNATDRDSGENGRIGYRILGESSQFSIEGDRLVGASAHQCSQRCRVSVEAFDHGDPPLTSILDVLVSVEAENAHDPVLSIHPTMRTKDFVLVHEDDADGHALAILSVTDLDGPIESQPEQRCAIVSGNEENTFELIHRRSVDILTLRNSSNIRHPRYELLLSSSDGQLPKPRVTYSNVTVFIEHLLPPFNLSVSSEQQSIHPSTLPINSFIHHINAPPGCSFHQIDNDSRFHVDTRTGIVTNRRQLASPATLAIRVSPPPPYSGSSVVKLFISLRKPKLQHSKMTRLDVGDLSNRIVGSLPEVEKSGDYYEDIGLDWLTIYPNGVVWLNDSPEVFGEIYYVKYKSKNRTKYKKLQLVSKREPLKAAECYQETIQVDSRAAPGAILATLDSTDFVGWFSSENSTKFFIDSATGNVQLIDVLPDHSKNYTIWYKMHQWETVRHCQLLIVVTKKIHKKQEINSIPSPPTIFQPIEMIPIYLSDKPGDILTSLGTNIPQGAWTISDDVFRIASNGEIRLNVFSDELWGVNATTVALRGTQITLTVRMMNGTRGSIPIETLVVSHFASPPRGRVIRKIEEDPSPQTIYFIEGTNAELKVIRQVRRVCESFVAMVESFEKVMKFCGNQHKLKEKPSIPTNEIYRDIPVTTVDNSNYTIKLIRNVSSTSTRFPEPHVTMLVSSSHPIKSTFGRIVADTTEEARYHLIGADLPIGIDEITGEIFLKRPIFASIQFVPVVALTEHGIATTMLTIDIADDGVLALPKRQIVVMFRRDDSMAVLDCGRDDVSVDFSDDFFYKRGNLIYSKKSLNDVKDDFYEIDAIAQKGTLTAPLKIIIYLYGEKLGQTTGLIDGTFVGRVEENQPIGSAILTLPSSSKYRLIDNNVGLIIDSMLVLRTSIVFDREENAVINTKIIETDTHQIFDLVVFIMDVNDNAPMIEKGQVLRFSDDFPLFHRLEWSDADSTVNQTFSIESSNDGLSIDKQGNIRFRNRGQPIQFNATIHVNDTIHETNTSVLIVYEPSGKPAPICHDSTFFLFTGDENFYVKCDSKHVTFRLNHPLFRINSISGMIRVNGSLPDAGIYSLDVHAYRNDIHPKIARFQVRVVVNPACLELNRAANQFVFHVNETINIGSTIGRINLPCMDEILMVAPNLEDFSLNPFDGQIRVLSKLDFETRRIYESTIDAIAIRGQVRQRFNLTIIIVDQVDEPPRFEQDLIHVHVNTTNVPTIIHRVAAFDEDREDVLVYQLVDGDSSRFTVDAHNGSLVMLQRPSKERMNLTIEVRDKAGLRQSCIVLISTDSPDNNVISSRPRFHKIFDVDIHENIAIGSHVAQITAEGMSKDHRFILEDSKDFQIDPISGIVTTNASIDYERRSMYRMKVQLVDEAWSIETSLVVRVIDENDNSPICQLDTLQLRVGDVVKAIDADSAQNGRIRFTMVSKFYDIDESTGRISRKRSISEDTTARVTIMDSGYPMRATSIVLTIQGDSRIPPVLQEPILKDFIEDLEQIAQNSPQMPSLLLIGSNQEEMVARLPEEWIIEPSKYIRLQAGALYSTSHRINGTLALNAFRLSPFERRTIEVRVRENPPPIQVDGELGEIVHRFNTDLEQISHEAFCARGAELILCQEPMESSYDLMVTTSDLVTTMLRVRIKDKKNREWPDEIPRVVFLQESEKSRQSYPDRTSVLVSEQEVGVKNVWIEFGVDGAGVNASLIRFAENRTQQGQKIRTIRVIGMEWNVARLIEDVRENDKNVLILGATEIVPQFEYLLHFSGNMHPNELSIDCGPDMQVIRNLRRTSSPFHFQHSDNMHIVQSVKVTSQCQSSADMLFDTKVLEADDAKDISVQFRVKSNESTIALILFDTHRILLKTSGSKCFINLIDGNKLRISNEIGPIGEWNQLELQTNERKTIVRVNGNGKQVDAKTSTRLERIVLAPNASSQMRRLKIRRIDSNKVLGRYFVMGVIGSAIGLLLALLACAWMKKKKKKPQNGWENATDIYTISTTRAKTPMGAINMAYETK